MIKDLGYRPYRPSGYTDDLGIIADRNQWVSAQIPGWYFRVKKNLDQVVSWLEENDVSYTDHRWALIIHGRDDATLFKLRWA